MSHKDALRDNIRYYSSPNGLNWYYPKCHSCGAEVPSWNYISGRKYTCKKCKEIEKLTALEFREEENLEIRNARLEKAIDRIKAKTNIQKYDREIEIVREMINGGGHVFDSTEEVIVALILLKNNIQFRHQVRFGKRYIADFVLDELKVVLEVDGDIFHGENRASRDCIRDNLIIAALGPSWEVIRIKTSTLNENVTRLPRAIRTILKKREMYRRNNNGQLPDWYNVEG